MLCNVSQVFISRIGGPNGFAQGGEAIELARAIITTMKTMCHPVRRQSPPPDIALESISQTTLGLSTSRPVEAPGSNQHGSVPLMPRRSCKIKSRVSKFAADKDRKVCQLHTCTIVCTMSAKYLLKSAISVHIVCTIRLMHTLHMHQKSARDADFYASLCLFCIKCAQVCTKCASSLHKVCKVCMCSASSLHKKDQLSWEQLVFLKNADLMHTLCRLVHTLFRKDTD